MLRVFFIFNAALLIFLTPAFATSGPAGAGDDKKIVITSQTLTAYNKRNTAVFEGDVKTIAGDLTIYSDKMTVFYDNPDGDVTKIHATGNVKVHKEGRTIFSEEATYLTEEEKIIFNGKPRVVEGENVVSGRRIIYFLKDDRAVVEDSRVILIKRQGQD
jgi:lipopolysaccharide export system protein LptA